MKTLHYSPDAMVSVVAPVCCAEDFIESFLKDLSALLREQFKQYEIIVVDDLSNDRTTEIVHRVQQTTENIQFYQLNLRSGWDVALVAGIDNSIGDYVVTLDPRTDPIEIIPKLFERIRPDCEVVYGVDTAQVSRRGPIRRALAAAFFSLFRRFTGLQIPDGITDYRLFTRRVVNYITQHADRHMLIEVMPAFATSSYAVEPYTQLVRTPTHPHHLYDQLVSGFSILLSSSIKPLRLLTLLAFIASTFSLAYAAYIVVVAIFKRHVIEGWISLALPTAIMFFLVSLILGILSEYIYTVVQETRRRPIYTIRSEALSSTLDVTKRLNVIGEEGAYEPRDQLTTRAATRGQPSA